MGPLPSPFGGGYFFLATRESLLRTALHNFGVASSRERLSAEPLFQESQTALARSGDVWMYLNMGLVQESRYFRNEWLYRNLDETGRYRAGAVRLGMQAGQYKEERQFLLKEDVTGPAAIDPVLLQGLPGNLELVRAETATPKAIAAGIARNPSESTAATRSNTVIDAPGRALRNGAPVEDGQPVLLADRRASSRRGESARSPKA